ncbi:MAG: hypothetical protein JWR39_2553 [Devosia sp.]|nr:hypothetical protein [Devosia sp.]
MPEAAPAAANGNSTEPQPRRVLMSVDAVGGVWRYGMDLASALREQGFSFVFAGFGPRPSVAQVEEAQRLGTLVWVDVPLDWTAQSEAALDVIPELLAGLVDEHGVDLLHLNLPSQAYGLRVDVPVLVVSHSCVVTWFAAVRNGPVPLDWLWQQRRNRGGLDMADAVVAPSETHAEMLRRSYGTIENLRVVYNGAHATPTALDKSDLVFAAGRWWDEGKNGRLLDQAAEKSVWPVVMAGANSGPNGQYLALEHADHRGELPHQAVKALMAEAAIVASPSLYEPFGLAPLEAAGARAALVLADIPTYRELWDGVALFAGPHDPDGFAARINQLAADPDLRAELAAAAQERAQRFSVGAQAAAMADLYRNLLPSGVRLGDA